MNMSGNCFTDKFTSSILDGHDVREGYDVESDLKSHDCNRVIFYRFVRNTTTPDIFTCNTNEKERYGYCVANLSETMITISWLNKLSPSSEISQDLFHKLGLVKLIGQIEYYHIIR